MTQAVRNSSSWLDNPTISYQDVFGKRLEEIPYGLTILSEETMTLLRDLKIRVVGIEDPSTRNGFFQRFKLASRHKFSSDIIVETLESLGSQTESLYLGGSAHISSEGEIALSEGFYHSLPTVLTTRGGLSSRKIFLGSQKSKLIEPAFKKSPPSG